LRALTAPSIYLVLREGGPQPQTAGVADQGTRYGDRGYLPQSWRSPS
jgi:hypothetical protein